MKFAFRTLVIANLIGVILSKQDALADIFYEHSGSSNPVAEGWTYAPPLNPGAGGVSSGPVTNDLGHDAWRIVDHSSLDGSYQSYSENLSTSQLAAVNSNGWEVTMNLRVTDLDQTPAASTFMEYYTGSRLYALGFGSTSTGDPIVNLISGVGVSPQPGTVDTLIGGGSGYHEYKLIYSNATNSASLYIDGSLRDSGYTGLAYFHQASFWWGAGDSRAQGAANFRVVQFGSATLPPPPPVPVPEPSSIALFAVAAGCCFCWSVRQRRADS